jgi:hypothetical protein
MDSAVFDLLASAASKSSSTDTTALILQGVAGILSIPFLTAALTALARFMSPTQRISARLRSDLAIYRDLPASAGKDVLGQRINETLSLLNARYVPKTVAASEFGIPSRQPVGRSSLKKWLGLGAAVVLTIVGIIVIVVSITYFFQRTHNGFWWTAISISIGLLLSLAWLVREWIAGLFRRKSKVPPKTK